MVVVSTMWMSDQPVEVQFTMRSSRAQLVAIALVAVLGGGCAPDPRAADGSAGVRHGVASPSSTVDLSILEAGGRVDARVFGTPAELLRSPHAQLAAQGTIDGIEEGPTVLESESGLGYPDLRESFAAVRVKVDVAYRGESDLRRSPYVYVALSRGVEAVDEKGEPVRSPGSRSTVTDLDAFAEALPIGTRVMVMGQRWAALPGQRVVPAASGDALTSAPFVSGLHPQALAVETKPGGPVSGWPGYTFSRLVDETARTAEE
ncbi:hypothetical protein ACJ5H2_02530 [Nocardioides sp. R1-1]|uniref:hypothetical protein n=1 Tax=Nocardioides sp. R1-1 TaxID=3383502 RepID=UPI0038D0CD03